MDTAPSRSSRARKAHTGNSFENAASVQNQVGTQDVRGSVYNNYGPVHYHPTRTSYTSSRSEADAATPSAKQYSIYVEKESREERVERERQRRFKALYFEQLETRHATIEKAYASTCEWFLSQPEYWEWSNSHNIGQHHNFLWIKGKPGSGKSTLMKFLFNVVSSTAGNGFGGDEDYQVVVVSFFFNARGSNLETSPIGTYRSLLFQILDKVPDLRTALDYLPVMTITSLQTVFEEVVRKLDKRSLTIFIDALDECHEEDIQDMVYFLGNLTTIALESNVSLHICLSSRHYPFIKMKHGLSLILENELQHTEDMRNYVQNQLDIGQSENAQNIRQKILQKASGVFLWVKLVVKILNGRYRHGRLFELEQHLDSIPSGLEDLFSDILTREGVDDPRAQKELALCLQWVLFSYRPLSPAELYFAILVGTSSTYSPWLNPGSLTEDDMHRFILSCSKGLLEQTRGKSGTVQFIHESVRNFFLSGTSLVQLGSVEDVAGFAHARLADCCFAYIESIRLSDIPYIDFDDLPETQSKRLTDTRDELSAGLPLLFYSVWNLLRHSDSALALGILQDDFIAELDLSKILRLHNLLVQIPSERHDAQQTHFAYFLAVKDLPTLLSRCLSSVQDIELCHGMRGSLLHGAHAARSFLALKVLLTPPPYDTPWPTLNKSLSQEARRDIRKAVSCFITEDVIPSNKTFLCWAVENKNLSVARCLLRTGRINPNLPSSDGSTPLALAALNGDASILAILLQFGARVVTNGSSSPPLHPYTMEVEAHSAKYTSLTSAKLPTGATTYSLDSSLPFDRRQPHTPQDMVDEDTSYDQSARKATVALHAAARGGHDEVIDSLLNAGADVDQIGGDGDRALHLAAKNGHQATVRLLLESGANIDAMSERWGTALHVASKNHHDRVVNVLVEYGANVNARSGAFGTALHVAARYGYREILQILISAGTDMNLQRGMNRMTALHEASADGNIVTASTLLYSGADFNVRNGTDFNALMIAMIAGHHRIVEMILEAHVIQLASDPELSLVQALSSLSNEPEATQLLQTVIRFVVALDNFAVLAVLFHRAEVRHFIDWSLEFGDELLWLAIRRRSIKSYQAMANAGLKFTSLTAATCRTIASAANGERKLLRLLLRAVTEEQLESFKTIIWNFFTNSREEVEARP